MKYSVAIMALAIPACGCTRHGHMNLERRRRVSAPSGLAALARARAAVPESAWKDIRGLTARGRIDTSGLSGSWTRAEDLAEGRYVVAADLGVMRIAEGYDGRVHWRQDPSGGVHPLNGAFSQMRARTDAWLARRGWLAPTPERHASAPPKRARSRGGSSSCWRRFRRAASRSKCGSKPPRSCSSAPCARCRYRSRRCATRITAA